MGKKIEGGGLVLRKNEKKYLEKNWKFYFFKLMVPYFHSNRFFSGKITILSYKTLFGSPSGVISENLMEQFFRKFQKTVISGKNGHFWHVWPKSAK